MRERLFPYERREGNAEEIIQEALCRTEADAGAIFQSVDKDGFVFSQAEFSKIVEFAGLMFGRVIASRNSSAELISNLAKDLVTVADQDEAWLSTMVTKYRAAGFEVTSDAVRESIKRVATQSGSDKKLVLYGMFHKADVVSDHLRSFDWRILITPEDTPFITSDNPVVTWGTDQYGQITLGHGFGKPNVSVYFPLSSRICLQLTRGMNCGRFEAPRSLTRLVNKSLIRLMTRNAYSCEHNRKVAEIVDHEGASLKYLKDVFVPSKADNKEVLKHFTAKRADGLVSEIREMKT